VFIVRDASIPFDGNVKREGKRICDGFGAVCNNIKLARYPSRQGNKKFFLPKVVSDIICDSSCDVLSE
jgi:hypothetical protein